MPSARGSTLWPYSGSGSQPRPAAGGPPRLRCTPQLETSHGSDGFVTSIRRKSPLPWWSRRPLGELASAYSEVAEAGSPSGRQDHAGKGDFRLIDVTNPTLPFEASNWGVHRNLGGPPAPGLGCDPDPEYGHSVEPRADGKVAWVAYWDSGFIALDLSNPADPVYKGRTSYPGDADGDGHSSNFDEGRKLLFAADEDFCKTSSGTEKGFGFLRVYDYSSLGAPVQIGSYKTPNASGSKDVNAGDYTIHNPLLSGTDLYVSWYTDGIRVLDAKDPRNVREVAYFVPPSVNNPIQPSQRGTLTNATQVWGVAYDEARKLVYASDMNSGLWILKRTK